MINLKNIAVLLFSLVVPGLAIAQTEVLYNGIHLPEQWPPRYTEPQKAQDMPIPYLKQKPEVIPVNVGRQLFVDSFLIAETNLNRVIHTPRFYEGNPVLEPDKEWEKTTEGGLYAAPFSDGIWYDEKDGKFKMWYLAVQVFFTKETIRPFIPDMPNRKTASTGQNLYWIFGTKPIL